MTYLNYFCETVLTLDVIDWSRTHHLLIPIRLLTVVEAGLASAISLALQMTHGQSASEISYCNGS